MSDQPAPAHLADPRAFFDQPAHPRQRRYEILRAFFVENLSAAEVARRFECSRHAVYSVIRDFRSLAAPADFFFRDSLPPGRLTPPPASPTHAEIVRLRKLNLSVPDIKAQLDASCDQPPSERAIAAILDSEGFARLPRRTRARKAVAPASAVAVTAYSPGLVAMYENPVSSPPAFLNTVILKSPGGTMSPLGLRNSMTG